MEQRSTHGAGLPDDVFDEALTARAVLDEHGIVTGWSEGARRLLGYRPDEIVGRPAGCLLDGDASAGMLRAAQDAPRWNGTLALRHRNGGRVEAGVIAHHRTQGDTAPDWFVVSPLDGAARPEDDKLVQWCFQQSPCCSMSVFDTHLRRRRVTRYMEQAGNVTEAEIRGLRAPEAWAHPVMDRAERAMLRALETGEPQYMEAYERSPGESRGHAWWTFLYPLRDDDGAVHGVASVTHDTTEQYWARKRLELLNDAGTRIGSTLDVARTAQELTDVAVPEFADLALVDLLPDPDSPRRPGLADRGGSGLDAAGPVRLRRVAQRSVLEGTPETVLPLGEVDAYAANSPMAECLATGRGVLRAEFDPSQTDWSVGHPGREEALRAFGIHSAMAVPLRARGTTLGVVALARHRQPQPFCEEDLLLAGEIAARAALSIDNARRYTRERDTAVALQRNLLPRQLPGLAAVEAAFRYLPTAASTGVGGDWFDVIPLSSARVALVVGDVVGHGIQAAATMGRLRTAVRTLADADLPPDELLTHLDDLVLRMYAETDQDSTAQTGQTAEIAEGFCATCLYAVYDPVTRVCTLARAGHPPPAVVSPDGTVDLLDVPAGLPLGVGGLPFETTEVTLPEGSILALYSDGLIESRHHDIDRGITRLRTALAHPATSLDGLCGALLGTLPPDDHPDDVALLLARTHALDARHVATWNLPADPAVVSKARKLVAGQLDAWGLTDASYVTELVVSELVTNSIRYAHPPIRLRLIHDRNLICEVSDAASTAPRLRRARTYDEGGRGLLLVAQLTQAWGTRHTDAGKTIWAEQGVPM